MRVQAPRLLWLAALLFTLLGAGTVSASAAHGPETRVRAIPTATTAAVAHHSSETAGHVGRLRPPAPGFVSGSCVATEAAGGAGDHIVLGLRNAGLEETAAKVGGRTLLGDPQWQTSLQQAIGEPGTRFTVALDGLSGSTPYSQVTSAIQNGLTPLATPTNWELAQLYQAGRIGDVTLVSGGQVVPNPWGG